MDGLFAKLFHTLYQSQRDSTEDVEILQLIFHLEFSCLCLCSEKGNLCTFLKPNETEYDSPHYAPSRSRGGGPRPFEWKCIRIRKNCMFSEYFLWKDTYPSLTWQWVFPFSSELLGFTCHTATCLVYQSNKKKKNDPEHSSSGSSQTKLWQCNKRSCKWEFYTRKGKFFQALREKLPEQKERQWS